MKEYIRGHKKSLKNASSGTYYRLRNQCVIGGLVPITPLFIDVDAVCFAATAAGVSPFIM